MAPVLPLGLVLVAFLAAEIRFIDLHRARHRLRRSTERLPDAVGEMPCRLLGDPQITVQLHAGDAP